MKLMDGVVLAMSGNTLAHLRILRNLSVELDGRLRGRPCEVLSNELKVKVEMNGDYFYPDLVGYRGTPIFERPNQVALLNPALLIEILSPSAEGYDRGRKFFSLPADSNVEGVCARIPGNAARRTVHTAGGFGLNLQGRFRSGCNDHLCLHRLRRASGGCVPGCGIWGAEGVKASADARQPRWSLRKQPRHLWLGNARCTDQVPVRDGRNSIQHILRVSQFVLLQEAFQPLTKAFLAMTLLLGSGYIERCDSRPEIPPRRRACSLAIGQEGARRRGTQSGRS
jgi:hypothetical protein